MQDSIACLSALTDRLHDSLEDDELRTAGQLLDRIQLPLSPGDIEALVSLLDFGGDSAKGLSWTVVHLLEADSAWPRWDLITDIDHEWVEVLVARIRNGDAPQQR